MIKILAYAHYNNGCSYHRVITPMAHMQGEVDTYTTNQFNEADYGGVDMVFYSRELPSVIMEKVNALRVKHGFKLCVDIDDFWEVDPHHFLYKHCIESKWAEKQIWHIKNADLVTTTNDRLAAEIALHNKNVHVLPNAIPRKGQFDIERLSSKNTRLFWQGTVTHEQDIMLLQPPISALFPIAEKIQMVMAGFEDTEQKADVWDRMIIAYTTGARHQYRLEPGVHVAEYYKAYAHADICLIPLLNSPFNRMKSNLKVLEAANLGLPVICSHVHPYMDLPVLYAKNSTDWVKHIQKLVASKKRQKEAGQELKEYCDTHYNFEKINRERKEIFEYQKQLV